jgi:hypothetical protein
LALRLAELSNKASHNYNTTVKQAPSSAASALKAHKAFISKVNQNKRLLITITPKA